MSFEQAFGDVERAADAAIASGQGFVALAKKLQKAAREGNIAAVKRAQGDFDAALREVRQATAGPSHRGPCPTTTSSGISRTATRPSSARPPESRV